MCSITGILELKDDPAEPREARSLALRISARQRHRGPDWSGIIADRSFVLAHERLAIVDVDHGAQPIVSADDRLVLAVNGEIYNHLELFEGLAEPYSRTTGSDCEIVSALYLQSPHQAAEWLCALNGIFAFVLYDRRLERYLIGRDPIGVVPLYTGRDRHGRLFVASELKALSGICTTVDEFPPGHYLDSSEGEIRPYFQPMWRSFSNVTGRGIEPSELRFELEQAVERQLMCDVPYGVLLSGGLDSSVIAALAKQHVKRRVETKGRTEAWWPQLHSFAIGLAGAPDLEAARKVAAAIGSVHHEFLFTIQEGIDALEEVIRHIESYDVTTVRASTPMFLLARRIKAMGIKMVLSGEGSDEIFGGYLYFHHAPSAREFHEETVRKLDQLHKFDCLRANKSMAAWGVEARVPFLDLRFLEAAMNFDPALKMVDSNGIEKRILRQACEDLLPPEILWRQKEQFSDGVGYRWIDALKEHAASEVSKSQLEKAHFRFPENPPQTSEGYFYRQIFESHFPQPGLSRLVPSGPTIACSSAVAIEWDESFKNRADPSGRSVSVHCETVGPRVEVGSDS